MWYYSCLLFIIVFAAVCVALAIHWLLRHKDHFVAALTVARSQPQYPSHRSSRSSQTTTTAIVHKVVLRCICYPLIPLVSKVWGVGIEVAAIEQSSIPYTIYVIDGWFSNLLGFMVSCIYFSDPSINTVAHEVWMRLKRRYVDEYYKVGVRCTPIPSSPSRHALLSGRRDRANRRLGCARTRSFSFDDAYLPLPHKPGKHLASDKKEPDATANHATSRRASEPTSLHGYSRIPRTLYRSSRTMQHQQRLASPSSSADASHTNADKSCPEEVHENGSDHDNIGRSRGIRRTPMHRCHHHKQRRDRCLDVRRTSSMDIWRNEAGEFIGNMHIGGDNDDGDDDAVDQLLSNHGNSSAYLGLVEPYPHPYIATAVHWVLTQIFRVHPRDSDDHNIELVRLMSSPASSHATSPAAPHPPRQSPLPVQMQMGSHQQQQQQQQQQTQTKTQMQPPTRTGPQTQVQVQSQAQAHEQAQVQQAQTQAHAQRSSVSSLDSVTARSDARRSSRYSHRSPVNSRPNSRHLSDIISLGSTGHEGSSSSASGSYPTSLSVSPPLYAHDDSSSSSSSNSSRKIINGRSWLESTPDIHHHDTPKTANPLPQPNSSRKLGSNRVLPRKKQRFIVMVTDAENAVSSDTTRSNEAPDASRPGLLRRISDRSSPSLAKGLEAAAGHAPPVSRSSRGAAARSPLSSAHPLEPSAEPALLHPTTATAASTSGTPDSTSYHHHVHYLHRPQYAQSLHTRQRSHALSKTPPDHRFYSSCLGVPLERPPSLVLEDFLGNRPHLQQRGADQDVCSQSRQAAAAIHEAVQLDRGLDEGVTQVTFILDWPIHPEDDDQSRIVHHQQSWSSNHIQP
ncbi:hypothetical protein BX666DRAFT_153282 [Dichotomocladium elegans]|nr:hypothetical protein BX666DRAFT_153282 [Dichotomocladium elegans]